MIWGTRNFCGHKYIIVFNTPGNASNYRVYFGRYTRRNVEFPKSSTSSDSKSGGKANSPETLELAEVFEQVPIKSESAHLAVAPVLLVAEPQPHAPAAGLPPMCRQPSQCHDIVCRESSLSHKPHTIGSLTIPQC